MGRLDAERGNRDGVGHPAILIPILPTRGRKWILWLCSGQNQCQIICMLRAIHALIIISLSTGSG